jgi:hypothetical protein
MRANSINHIKQCLTPAQRAEGLARLREITNDLAVRLKAKHERQSQQAAAINELELTGETQ